jgi:outer membrane protein assembly factor BamB
MGKVIVNVGGKAEAFDASDSLRDRKRKLAAAGVSVAAFDLKTGEVKWKVDDAWGASYASPVPATIHGQTKVLVYAGGESDPAIGGLLCIDPASGTVHDRFPWRSDDYIQAIGTSPLVIPGKNRALVTTCYPKADPLARRWWSMMRASSPAWSGSQKSSPFTGCSLFFTTDTFTPSMVSGRITPAGLCEC